MLFLLLSSFVRRVALVLLEDQVPGGRDVVDDFCPIQAVIGGDGLLLIDDDSNQPVIWIEFSALFVVVVFPCPIYVCHEDYLLACHVYQVDAVNDEDAW